MNLATHLLLPVGCGVVTATCLLVFECVACNTTDVEIQAAIDQLESKLNEYRLVTDTDKDALRLFEYYYSGLMAKYQPLKVHHLMVKQLTSRYNELTRSS